MSSLLLVESEPGQRRLIKEYVERKMGLSVEAVATAREALFLIEKTDTQFVALILDLHLSDMSGLQMVRQLRQSHNLVPVILLSAHGDMHLAVEAMRAGANDFLTKPVPADKLIASLHQTCGLMREKNVVQSTLSMLNDDGQARRLHDLEAEIIAFALDYYKGRMSEVARRLGIGRSTLYRKVHDMGLDSHVSFTKKDTEVA